MCVVFGLGLLSGGIASAVYASDNSDLYHDVCFFGDNSGGDCDDLQTVYNSEAASAVSSGSIVCMYMDLQYVATCCC